MIFKEFGSFFFISKKGVFLIFALIIEFIIRLIVYSGKKTHPFKNEKKLKFVED